MAARDAAHRTWTARNTNIVRQTMFLQNWFATRKLLDDAEDGFNRSQGIKPLNRDPKIWPGG